MSKPIVFDNNEVYSYRDFVKTLKQDLKSRKKQIKEILKIVKRDFGKSGFSGYYLNSLIYTTDNGEYVSHWRSSEEAAGYIINSLLVEREIILNIKNGIRQKRPNIKVKSS